MWTCSVRIGRRLGGLALLFAAALGAACTEKLQNDSVCGTLCPEQQVGVRDTVIEPIELDSTLTGFPLLGSEPSMLLAARGDTADTRVIVRFDTLLITSFQPTVADSARPITELDSAYVRVHLDPRGAIRPASVTLEVYDVDTTGTSDTAQAAVLARFRPDKLVGSLTLPGEKFIDSVDVPLNKTYFVNTLQGVRRMRLGFRLKSPQPAQLRMRSLEGGLPALLRYRPPGDTSVKVIPQSVSSNTPLADPLVRSDLIDYVLTVKGTPAPPGTELSVGGLPARRSYLRFAIPSRILDSTNVLRATLTLTQRPVRAFALDDTMPVILSLSTAASTITDVVKASSFLSPVSTFRSIASVLVFATDTLKIVPTDSGQKKIEMAGILQLWKASGPNGVQRVMVLRSGAESSLPAEFRFFSRRASAALRPTLRISYVPGRVLGLP